MGNVFSTDLYYPFVGREEELKEVLGRLENFRLLSIYGMSKCGKTRFVGKVLETLEKDNLSKNARCYSCFLDNEDSHIENTILELVRELLTDENLFSSVQDALEKLIKFFSSGTCILIIDNIDVLLKRGFKETLLQFIKKALHKCRNLKIVLSGSTKLKFVTPVFSEVILKPIGIEDLQKIIHNASNEISKQRDEDEVFIKGIAVLCEGLPLPATMAGKRLCDEHCVIICTLHDRARPCVCLQNFALMSFLQHVHAMETITNVVICVYIGNSLYWYRRYLFRFVFSR